MSLLLAKDLSLAFGPKILFENAHFSVGPRDRIGLVGPNGTGKSSLLRILAGERTSDTGELRWRRQTRVGYLPQDLTGGLQGPVLDAVLRDVPGRDRLEAAVQDAQATLDSVETPEEEQLEVAQRLADLHTELDQFEERFGRHRAERILKGLGFKAEDFGRPTEELSGGWRMRAALASLLLQDPDLLLLDEPTNHLDLPTLAWFDGFLRRSSKAMILISHDRDFLNRQVDRILSLEVEGLRSYAGNYDKYKTQRALELEQLEARAEAQAARRAEVEAFAERFGAKASKARQAQSRLRRLEKEEVIEVRQQRNTLKFQFPEVQRSAQDVVTLKQIHKSFGQNTVYRGLNATLQRGQRVAVVGVNGAGKTTLLKLIAGELDPDSGTIALGGNVTLGYYAQHHAETLDARSTILEEVHRRVPDKPQSWVRGLLGAFLFSGDEVEKPVGVLSGGERARVALARLLTASANFLILDEPTNHLDLDSSEALIEALKEYSGTLMFVSHNRSFLNQLATHVWEVKDHAVIPHPGNLDDYLERLSRESAALDASAAAPVAKPTSEKERRRLEAEARQQRSAVEGPIRKEITALEARIAQLEATQKEQEAQLADPALYSDFARAKPLVDAHRAGKEELASLYTQWEQAQERLGAVQQQQR